MCIRLSKGGAWGQSRRVHMQDASKSYVTAAS